MIQAFRSSYGKIPYRLVHNLDRGIRHGSSFAPMNIIVLPITTKKNFIYYTYHEAYDLSTYLELQKQQSNSKKDELRIRIIMSLLKLTTKAKTTWQNMKTSNNKVLKKSYDLVQTLLDKIDWFEICLSSIPSRRAILREVKVETKNQELLQPVSSKHNDRVQFYNKLSKSEINPFLDSTTAQESDFHTNFEVYKKSLRPIPLYYPQSIIDSKKVRQFVSKDIQEKYQKYHMKQLVLCAVGLPLTIPFIILPVIPNVPGFYLCYRIYCHWKVLAGLKHLDYLVNDQLPTPADNVIGHLSLTNQEQLSQAYLKNAKDLLANDSQEERLLINQATIDDIKSITNSDSIASILHNSLIQESKRLTSAK